MPPLQKQCVNVNKCRSIVLSNRIIVLQLHRVKKRYDEKTELIGNKDSYTLSENKFSVDFDNFHLISYTSIVKHLVFRPSPYFADDMKAYKSLEAYNQVIEGWVRNVKVDLNENGLTVVKGKVGYGKVQLLYTNDPLHFH